MVEAARNAVRLILTLELVQSQSTQRQLSPQQEAELAERKRNAENELKGAISQLYPIVYTPQNSEQRGQTYVLDALTVQSYSSAPQTPHAHQRGVAQPCRLGQRAAQQNSCAGPTQ